MLVENGLLIIDLSSLMRIRFQFLSSMFRSLNFWVGKPFGAYEHWCAWVFYFIIFYQMYSFVGNAPKYIVFGGPKYIVFGGCLENAALEAVGGQGPEHRVVYSLG